MTSCQHISALMTDNYVDNDVEKEKGITINSLTKSCFASVDSGIELDTLGGVCSSCLDMAEHVYGKEKMLSLYPLCLAAIRNKLLWRLANYYGTL